VFAIKVLKDRLFMMEDKEKQAAFDEIELMKEKPHPFIVKAIDDFIDNSDRLCIV
jgi:hypothetical protein